MGRSLAVGVATSSQRLRYPLSQDDGPLSAVRGRWRLADKPARLLPSGASAPRWPQVRPDEAAGSITGPLASPPAAWILRAPARAPSPRGDAAGEPPAAAAAPPRGEKAESEDPTGLPGADSQGAALEGNRPPNPPSSGGLAARAVGEELPAEARPSAAGCCWWDPLLPEGGDESHDPSALLGRRLRRDGSLRSCEILRSAVGDAAEGSGGGCGRC